MDAFDIFTFVVELFTWTDDGKSWVWWLFVVLAGGCLIAGILMVSKGATVLGILMSCFCIPLFVVGHLLDQRTA